MARVVGYAYPWDVLGDPGFVERAQALGISHIALAAAYHTTRAATPWHPRHALVNARTAALYRPVREAAWTGRRLAPVPADWVADDDPFASAAEVLASAGFEVTAWVVLTHATRLGDASPDVAVVNCFGEAYPYALCPRHGEIPEYTASLAAEAVRGVSVSAIVLEACGQLGVEHGGHHEKTDGAYDDTARWLLSVCCCRACREAWRDYGQDPDDTVRALRGAVRAATLGGPDPSADMLPAEMLGTVLRARQEGTDALRRRVLTAIREAAPAGPRIVLHGHPDPWRTGALPGLTPSAGGDVDTVVTPCWPTGPESVETVRQARTALPDRVAVGAYVTVLPPVAAAQVTPHVRGLLDAGAEEIHLYHLGLAGPARQPLLAQAVRAVHDFP